MNWIETNQERDLLYVTELFYVLYVQKFFFPSKAEMRLNSEVRNGDNSKSQKG